MGMGRCGGGLMGNHMLKSIGLLTHRLDFGVHDLWSLFPRAKLLYLPKYSPDLNPIEQAFSKFKAHLRKAAERTIPRLCRRIGALMTAFSSQECANRVVQGVPGGRQAPSGGRHGTGGDQW
jgi:hypothetical protein